MNKAYLLTGGNEGDSHLYLQQARTNIEHICGRISALSSVWQTAAWGFADQPDFLNQVLLVETLLTADELLEKVLSIEETLGRKRSVKNAPRTLDIDILFFNHDQIEKPGLQIPHPRIAERRFVLEPLNEIAPDFIHPVSGKTVHFLLLECKDPLPVKKINSADI